MELFQQQTSLHQPRKNPSFPLSSQRLPQTLHQVRLSNMKLLLFLIVIWAWCATDVISARRDVTFDLTATAIGNIYLKPIQVLRAQTKGSEKFGIPILKNPATVQPNQQYILVDLIAAKGQTISLVIQVTDLYLVAYADKVGGKDRINFFQSTPRAQIKKLFPAGATERTIGVGESYVDLERFAGGRERIDLGITVLKKQITDKIYGKATISQKDEATFIIIAVQMISEASRFKYIENQVKTARPTGSFKPDSKTINLENNWDNISGAVQKSTNKVISPPLQLRNPNNTPWSVTNVDQIALDLGILKYKA